MRDDFPIFTERPELVYLDSAATAQKPQVVLDAMNDFYGKHNANVNRGAHFLGNEATEAHEGARRTVAQFIGAKKSHEIIFTKGATEAVNLVAKSWGEAKSASGGAFLKKGDEVVLSQLEHHSNIVPWLQLKERLGIELKYFDVSDEDGIIFDPTLITSKTKLVAISGMSNVLGTITELEPIIKAAHTVGAKVLIDACQLIVHHPVDVQALDIDFMVFSGHKLYGPTGIGVLYAKEALLKAMPPFMGGGDMIQEVFMDHFTPASLPNKFEAGTPNIAGAIGLEAAIKYIQGVGHTKIAKIETELTIYLLEALKTLPFIRIIGPQDASGSLEISVKRGPLVSFTMEGVHPHDIAEGLSQKGICVRAGHHCCQPLMKALGLTATARISLAFYNTTEEVNRAIEALKETYDYFK